MRPGVSSRMLEREASFVKRPSFHDSNASRFTHVTLQFSSSPSRSLAFLPARELPIRHQRPRRPLWLRGLECSTSHPKNSRGR